MVNIFGPICFGFFGPTFEAHYSYPFKKAKSWPFIFIKSSLSISNPKPHHFSIFLSSLAVLPIFFSFDFLSIPSSYLFFLPSQVFFLFLLFFFILFSFFSFYFLFPFFFISSHFQPISPIISTTHFLSPHSQPHFFFFFFLFFLFSSLFIFFPPIPLLPSCRR